MCVYIHVHLHHTIGDFAIKQYSQKSTQLSGR